MDKQAPAARITDPRQTTLFSVDVVKDGDKITFILYPEGRKLAIKVHFQGREYEISKPEMTERQFLRFLTGLDAAGLVEQLEIWNAFAENRLRPFWTAYTEYLSSGQVNGA